MNNHKRTQFLTQEIFDDTSETQVQFQEFHMPLDETPQFCAEMKDIKFVNDLEYHHYSISRKLHNFQEWKLRLIDKNSVHFGISFFI